MSENPTPVELRVKNITEFFRYMDRKLTTEEFEAFLKVAAMNMLAIPLNYAKTSFYIEDMAEFSWEMKLLRKMKLLGNEEPPKQKKLTRTFSP